ncbi:MAG: ribonuclease Z, partial [Bacteroidales bacterium]|nr:ribonuclease Z [Bacteroidales bacterium]
MEFSLMTLGSASARPTSSRFPSAHSLTVGGRLFLIDCGEGCQMQMARFKVPFSRLDNIFISHLHG